MAFDVNSLLTGKAPLPTASPLAPSSVLAKPQLTFYKNTGSPTVYDNTGHVYATPEEFFKAGGKWENVQTRTPNQNVTNQLTGNTPLPTNNPTRFTPLPKDIPISSPKPSFFDTLKLGAQKTLDLNTNANLETSKLLRDTGQSTARNAFSVSESLLNPLTGQDSVTPSDPVSKAILGTDKAIPSINDRLSTAQKSVLQANDKYNFIDPKASPAKKSQAALILAGLGVGFSSTADFSGLGGEEKAALKGLVEAKDIATAGGILKKIGLSDEVINKYAPKFAEATKPGEVAKIFQEIKNPATELPIKPPLLNFDPEKYAAEQANKVKDVAKTGIVQKGKDFLSLSKRKLVDFDAPIEDVLAQNKKEFKYSLLPQADITNQVDRVLRSPTLAGQFARDNGIVDVIKKTDNLNNLDQYLIAKQATKVAENGITTGRDLEKDKALITAFAPKYEEAAKVVTQYSHKLLDYAVESGLVTKDLAEALKVKYPDYVPLNRIFDELEKSNSFAGGKAVASLSKQTVVQKLVGSERDIQSPIQSLLEKTSDVFKQGEKNKAGSILANYKDLPGNPFDLRELKPGETAPHTISYLENGVKRTFETNKLTADAAKALNVQQMNILGKIFALPTRIAKVGITGINLPFVGANIAKDQITAFINSSHALKTSVGNPLVYTKALFEALGHGKLYDEMAREGALGTSFDIARDQVAPTIEKLRNEVKIPFTNKVVRSKAAYTVRHPSELLRAVENIIGRSEEFTRIKQYAGTKGALIDKGMNEAGAKIGAARAAREDTVNFARRGEWGQVLNSAFLYLNASIQGTRTLLRNAKEKPVQTAAKLAISVFTPVAAATAWNLSDPKRKAAYQDISDYEKQGNIIIVPPNPHKNDDGTWNVIKIPLSQEINNIANIPRRIIEQAHGLDPVSVSDIAGALAGTISPINPTTGSLASTLTPQAIKPSIEALQNKSLFTGKAQVPEFMTKLSPDQQVFNNTSGTAREIGGVLGASPIKVENFIKGTFGGVGSQVLNASDQIQAKAGILPKEQIGGQNVVDAILGRFSKAHGSFVDPKKSKLQPVFDQVQQLKAQGNNGAAQKIVDGLSPADYETYKALKSDNNQAVAQKALDAKLSGDENTAKDMVNKMSSDQYSIYQNLKNKTQEAGSTVAEASKSQTGLIHLISNYAKAFKVDPASAFKTLFTKEQLEKVVNDAVIMKRIDLQDSQAIKKRLSATKNQRLDHTIPLELGGSNDESNLKLVDKKVWESYTPVEDALGRALADKRINKKQAQQLIQDFKNGKISANDAINQVKN